MNNSTLIINRCILHQNIQNIQEHLRPNTHIIAVIKHDAYGLGLTQIAHSLEHEAIIDAFGIAHAIEGVLLRESGITKPIMLLSGILQEDLKQCIDLDIQILLHNDETLDWLEAYHQEHPNKKIQVNLKVNADFNRFGFKVGADLDRLIQRLHTMPYLEIVSTYSHPIEGEVMDSELTIHQHNLYLQALKQLETANINTGKHHFCNSGASEWFTQAHHDWVRLGRRLYMDSINQSLQTGITEPITWTASIVAKQTIQPQESAGYNQAFIAEKTTDIAIMNIGYGDGLMLYKLSKNMPVLVHGKSCLVRAVCMDTAIIDVTGLNVQVGDTVTLFGQQNESTLTSQSVAAIINEEGCTLTSLISPRVKRVYID